MLALDIDSATPGSPPACSLLSYQPYMDSLDTYLSCPRLLANLVDGFHCSDRSLTDDMVSTEEAELRT